MRRHVGKLLSTGIGLVALFFCSASGYGKTPPPDWLDADRFRELPWGAALEQAQAAFPDLSFVKYVISDEKETPAKVYERKDEVRKINGIRVDAIRYWFRDNTFYKVTIHLNSKVGPRTITTPAAEAYEKLSSRISGVMGEQPETRVDHGISSTNKKAVWSGGDLAITLLYLEPSGANDDDLILEIVKRIAGT